jgi:hypothetical protein
MCVRIATTRCASNATGANWIACARGGSRSNRRYWPQRRCWNPDLLMSDSCRIASGCLCICKPVVFAFNRTTKDHIVVRVFSRAMAFSRSVRISWLAVARSAKAAPQFASVAMSDAVTVFRQTGEAEFSQPASVVKVRKKRA